MANDNTKLQTETSADKARRSKLRIETEMGARKTAEAIGEEHVVVDSKLRKEREKKKKTPEDEKKKRHKKQVYEQRAKEQALEGAVLAGGVVASTIHSAVNGSDKDSGEEAFEDGGKAVAVASREAKGTNYSKKLKQSKNQQKKSEDYESHKKTTAKQEQKRNIKKNYAHKKRTKDAESVAKKISDGTKSVAGGAKDAAVQVVKFIKDHPMGCLIALLIVLLLVVIISVASTVMLFFSGTVNSMVASSYTAQDNDILTVEANYVALEEALQEQIDAIESDYPDYDEYRYNLAEIGHDEYELASYLTVLFEDYTPSEVSSTLQNIFDAQYELTITPITEIRTRTETRYRDETRYREEGGVLVPYTVTVAYEVEVEYEYHILQITLTNSGIGAVVAGAGLTEDQMERYQILLSTKGNKAYLFEDSIYANPSDDYLDYDVPGEYFTDNEFGNMIHEAEKYLGYPYVWGGSSPSTSFDCSGFVSYVINNCGNGWNVGRQTANGLKNCCSIIRPEEAKPGDLVFFQGTYNTSGASHVGIYVGDGMMIHCGNPISYASIETSYWEEHFYCFGRLP
ncbi:MAG: C40 family peptidase [Lachnospiraceae bacterium]|nr:C40 family peptidase [Lachnospiraceae bacterium]